jgi:hypothetical protein
MNYRITKGGLKTMLGGGGTGGDEVQKAPRGWWEALLQALSSLVGLKLEKFDMPLVRAHRPLQWRCDAEFGRQALAGANPAVIHAVTAEWIAGTGFTEERMAGEWKCSCSMEEEEEEEEGKNGKGENTGVRRRW